MSITHSKPALLGFVGRSGGCKTTIITDVIECLRIDGFTVSAIKRAHDGFDLDQPGKESWRLREAGCREVMPVGDRRWALLHEYRAEREPDPRALATDGEVDCSLPALDLRAPQTVADFLIERLELARSLLKR